MKKVATLKDMVKTRYLAKSIHEKSWGTFFNILEYKAENAGRIIIKVNPYNTSKLCSNCGTIVEKELSERIHNCPTCKLSIDRDLNAAINILNIGMKQM